MAKSKEMEIAIKIAGRVENSFKTALSTATKGLGSITKAVSAATASAAAAVGAITVAAVNVGKEFETAMSQVQATMLLDTGTAEGAAAMATLEEAARECGRTTAFSATEAAEALNYLALAGYDAEQAATALPTVLKLAGAGAMDLAAASDMVTDSMSALQIEATEENLNSFADQLAQTASKANTSVAQLGEAILTVGATGANLAGGTAELNTALGILADNGLKGAEGGTHLRNVILSLQSPTDKASAALKSLGVDVYDAEGNMRGLNNIFGDLNSAMEGMTQAQKDSITSTIFNKTDLTSANALLANCTDRWDELSEAIENSAGACEDMYAIQLDNLDGDIKILTSGLSDLGISIYKDLNGPMRSMTQLATGMVEELSTAYSEGGMEGMVGAIGGCLSESVGVISEYVPQVVAMGVDLIGSFVQGIADNTGPLADAAAQTMTVFIDGLFSLVPQILLVGIDIITQLVSSITGQLPTLITNGTQAITNFVSGIIQRLPTIISTAIQLVGSLTTGILSMVPQFLPLGIQLILNLAQGILSNLPQILQVGVQVIISLISGITQMLPIIIQGGIQLIISLIQGIIANLGNIVQAASQIVVALASGLIQAIPQLIAAIPQLVGAIIEAIVNTNWLDVGVQIIKGLIDGILSTGKSLWSAVKSLFTGGEVDIPDTSSQGAAVVNSYASGINSNAGIVTAAANNMAASAFSSLDISGAEAAGAQAGTAFSTGLNTSFSAGMATPVDISGLLSTESISTNMTTAGTDGATAFTTGFNTGLSAAIGTGMAQNSQAVTQAATNLENDINAGLDAGWQKAETSAQSAMQRLTQTVTAAASAAARAVKSAFEDMTITIPKPKIPIIDVSTNSVPYGEGGSVSIPKFSVNWNAIGGIFEKPTVFNTSSGLQGAGEAGPEALLPLDALWKHMEDIVSRVVKENSGSSIIDALIGKLQGISGGNSGGNEFEIAGTGGLIIEWKPTYNLYGSAGKDEVMEADSMSQAEFEKRMKQYEKDNRRRRL